MNTDTRTSLLEIGGVLVILLGIAAIVFAALFGLSLAIHMKPIELSSTVQTVVNISVTLAAAGTGPTLGFLVYRTLAKKIQDLERSHQELARRVNRHKPIFVVVAALFASLTMVWVGDAFEDKGIATALSLALTLLFGLSNELLIAESKAKQIFGGLLWGGAVLIVPCAALAMNWNDLGALWHQLLGLGTYVLCAITVIYLVAILAPFALLERG